MTIATRTGHLTAELHQLARPIHIAHQGRVHTLPPLLDQLRDACTPPSGTPTGSTRTAPGSRPPIRVNAVDALSAITVGISICHGRLNLPSPPRNVDWQKGVLALMAERAHDLTPQLADWLTLEVHDWWRTAALHTGWTPTQLRRLQ
ncbi:hypothetical protein, partial [Micromonospora sp. NPDC023956]|uniref:DUF7341 domain-containing protein n=1 Tax=Micromonospora sp. NPDC023956 TaxID=3155722 RepID=UPI00340A6016